jgi:hypothetical protein
MDDMSKQAVSLDIDEAQAIRIYRELAARFGWAGMVFTSADITDAPCYDDNGYEGIVPVTPAMVEAVMASYTWRKGLPERLAWMGHRMLGDCLTARPDGTFTVDGENFSADGSPLD